MATTPMHPAPDFGRARSKAGLFRMMAEACGSEWEIIDSAGDGYNYVPGLSMVTNSHCTNELIVAFEAALVRLNLIDYQLHPNNDNILLVGNDIEAFLRSLPHPQLNSSISVPDAYVRLHHVKREYTDNPPRLFFIPTENYSTAYIEQALVALHYNPQQAVNSKCQGGPPRVVITGRDAQRLHDALGHENTIIRKLELMSRLLGGAWEVSGNADSPTLVCHYTNTEHADGVKSLLPHLFSQHGYFQSGNLSVEILLDTASKTLTIQGNAGRELAEIWQAHQAKLTATINAAPSENGTSPEPAAATLPKVFSPEDIQLLRGCQWEFGIDAQDGLEHAMIPLTGLTEEVIQGLYQRLQAVFPDNCVLYRESNLYELILNGPAVSGLSALVGVPSQPVSAPIASEITPVPAADSTVPPAAVVNPATALPNPDSHPDSLVQQGTYKDAMQQQGQRTPLAFPGSGGIAF